MKFPVEAYDAFLSTYNTLMNQLSDLSSNYVFTSAEIKHEKLNLLKETLTSLLTKQSPISEFFHSPELLDDNYTEEELGKINTLGFLARNLAANMREATELLRKN